MQLPYCFSLVSCSWVDKLLLNSIRDGAHDTFILLHVKDCNCSLTRRRTELSAWAVSGHVFREAFRCFGFTRADKELLCGEDDTAHKPGSYPVARMALVCMGVRVWVCVCTGNDTRHLASSLKVYRWRAHGVGTDN